MAIRIDYTQLRISNHTTYVALNPCICQLATGVLKTRSGSCQPRAQIHHRPASCHGGYTLLSPSLHAHCVLSYSGISLPEARVLGQQAYIETVLNRLRRRHYTETLFSCKSPARSQLYHFKPKLWYLAEVHLFRC
jgi:hypothetical protein